MNIFIDTTNDDFYISLFSDDFVVYDYTHLVGYKKKVDLIADQFENILKRNNLEIDQINCFYTNIGPGYFTGARSSLVFLKTLSVALNKPLFWITTFDFLMFQNDQEKLYVDAQGQKVFEFDTEKFWATKDYLSSVEIKDYSDDITLNKIDYRAITQHFNFLKDKFKNAKNVLEIDALYIKQPQIGVRK
ncbi:tRNA (adenosine(37)-N6)-threonylcarbamoyltransferase complex dimerization subunit type 1 TsaB [Mycoplasma sp. Ms02]|uniref:tRNA threonylcarbamoyladenosine biosynthesis protein TsaB n=1 Tax=Mycoplasma sp. Ms02 TaxID=353851 RepID=UPI001C89E645|nr:tRNA (adenosine(37)-N6)-threonylcarbamoyltransferase complex dimerization subunit type 1 TsaB [Mycoplasma sp. Ms02]QZE12156.1 tRNA (adenosine(37)-N6)-threonylcarbamoyltransferase complex dimerization subunit type 1 TsaB [Mycoplasma sp. Ms02]